MVQYDHWPAAVSQMRPRGWPLQKCHKVLHCGQNNGGVGRTASEDGRWASMPKVLSVGSIPPSGGEAFSGGAKAEGSRCRGKSGWGRVGRKVVQAQEGIGMAKEIATGFKHTHTCFLYPKDSD